MDGKPKSVFAAAAWSCLWPGLGQIYAGRRVRGIALAAAAVAAYTLTAVLLFVPAFRIHSGSVLACAAGPGIFLFAIIDAYSSVKAYNSNAGASAGRSIAETAAVAALVLLANPLTQAALVVGSFTGSLESMEPAVYAGDRVFVDLCTFRFLGIHRGDMIVYRIPGRPGKLFMHRVVGLPGETVELADQTVRIDGAPLAQPWALSKRYYNRGDFGRKGQSVLVPPKSYYVLGDYSTRSDDSRYTGFISERNVIGRVFKRWYPLSRSGSVE